MDNTQHNISLAAQIEAILFYSGEEFSEQKLEELFEVSNQDISQALHNLEENLKGHGLILVRQNGRVQLGTHPDAASLIERYRQKQFSHNLGKAGLETLTIVLYEGPVTKADIDYLRGVNSATTLRQLRSRGLIEKVETHDGKRGYQVTGDTLRHLGISSPEDLPHYDDVKEEVEEVQEFRQQQVVDETS